jgi:LacI family transcriptional regulator
VATLAGVSASTVSRVLGGQTVQPRPGTAEAVTQAVIDLGYRADLVARSMRTGASFALGLVVDNLLDPVFPGLVQAIAERAGAAGYATVLGTATGGPEQAAREVELMLERRVDGLIIACSWPADFLGPLLARLPVPVVLTNTDGPLGDVSQLGADNRGGAMIAAGHLLGLGHRRVAYVGGPRSAPFHEIRLAGMREAWAEAGLDPGAIHVVEGDGTSPGGLRAVERILAEAPETTATACYNDLSAIGVVRGLQEAGRSVPGDMSVIGFDDIAEASWTQPSLTTVHQQTREMGRLAAEELVRLIGLGQAPGGVPARPTNVRLPMELRRRESTASPRT